MKKIEKILHYNYNTHLHVDKFDYKMFITTNKITKNSKNSEEKSFLSKNAFFYKQCSNKQHQAEIGE